MTCSSLWRPKAGINRPDIPPAHFQTELLIQATAGYSAQRRVGLSTKNGCLVMGKRKRGCVQRTTPGCSFSPTHVLASWGLKKERLNSVVFGSRPASSAVIKIEFSPSLLTQNTWLIAHKHGQDVSGSLHGCCFFLQGSASIYSCKTCRGYI